MTDGTLPLEDGGAPPVRGESMSGRNFAFNLALFGGTVVPLMVAALGAIMMGPDEFVEDPGMALAGILFFVGLPLLMLGGMVVAAAVAVGERWPGVRRFRLSCVSVVVTIFSVVPILHRRENLALWMGLLPAMALFPWVMRLGSRPPRWWMWILAVVPMCGLIAAIVVSIATWDGGL
ncbi:MAG TPA: hypothetical protein VF665_18040 [Longimicrobium sp.]|uniref:hypothetical protein n=1 Tax=Longimicrobium sp. TaxID=2029185 RepID=UPI002EDB9B6D